MRKLTLLALLAVVAGGCKKCYDCVLVDGKTGQSTGIKEEVCGESDRDQKIKNPVVEISNGDTTIYQMWGCSDNAK